MRKKLKSSDLQKFSFEESLINLTPLIDVVFVVLITFILIAPLLQTDHVELAQGSEKNEKNLSGQSPISIFLKQDNSIYLNHRLVTINELNQFLAEKKKQYPKEVPQIYPDKKANFGTYQEIKNCLENLGFEQMDVILQTN